MIWFVLTATCLLILPTLPNGPDPINPCMESKVESGQWKAKDACPPYKKEKLLKI